MSDEINRLLDLWPSNKELAGDLGLRWTSHARTMRCRGRIPRAYWRDLVDAAARRGIEGVTMSRLREAHYGLGMRRS
jgi:hypothetical protein